MNMLRVIPFMLMMFLSVLLMAQPKPDIPKKAQKAYEQAMYEAGLGNLEEAEKNMLKVIKVAPEFTWAKIQLAEMYIDLKQYKKSRDMFLAAYKQPSPYKDKLLMALGDAEMKLENFEDAKAYYTKFAEMGGHSPKLKNTLKNKVASADFARNAKANPKDIDPIRLGENINSENYDYFPALTVDNEVMIFTRHRRDAIPPNEDIYVSYFIDGEWTRAENIGSPVNSDLNEGAIALSPDGKFLFFTGCNFPKGMGSCDIYVSKRVGLYFTQPVLLSSPLNSKHYETQPSVSVDGNTIYFVSARPGGYGGLDIWKINIDDQGNMTNPENLGPTINTSGDDERPFVHPDGQTLYFASDGHVGMGETDIFLSRKTSSGAWGEPENMGYPINSVNKELGIFITADGSQAYFASDKGGSSGIDIYSFELPEELKPQIVTYVKGNVYDKKTGAKLKARIELIDLETQKVTYSTVTDKETGEFLVSLTGGKNYAYNVSAKGYLFYSENFALEEATADSKPFDIDIPLSKYEVGEKVVLKNIFFETSRYSLLPRSQAELDKLAELMTKNPNMKIEIGGHTDSRGGESENLELSNFRAKEVVEYLSNKGIDASRLTAKGYGESSPVADNETDAGRALNRRTEFKVLGL